MTNPEQSAASEHNTNTSRLRELLAGWYSADEEFAYKTNDGWAILKFDELLLICGDKIAPLPDDVIKDSFDKYRKIAELIRTKGDEAADRTRSVGQEVLKRYI